MKSPNSGAIALPGREDASALLPSVVINIGQMVCLGQILLAVEFIFLFGITFMFLARTPLT